ncbi:MAG: class I SAM-dependent methyltransferase [Acidobacteria bacterium]|nr:MAG: class I SAM-dependent methyltransferase [Acidobacteriota bacterium]
MRNPWLDVPPGDYERHMSSPAVDQLSTLARLFGEALEVFRPADVLLLGIATGNGLDRIDANVTRHVTGIDINPEYLARTRTLYSTPAFDLTLQCADAAAIAYTPATYDFVHCALVLEYLDWRQLLVALAPAIRPGGGLSVVLQRPSATAPPVTPTPYASLERLETVFHFVEAQSLIDEARREGLELRSRRTVPLQSGKAFELLLFEKASGRS